VLYDRVRVEPTDQSFHDAIGFARERQFDAFVAVGGGSTIDTAKAVNLYTTYPPADFLDYVNAPIGKGMPVPGPLKPLIAVPTTAGTGSETTGVSIFDFQELHAKTGIANRWLKPTLGLLDPGKHADVASAGGGVQRARYPEPRGGVVYGVALRRASSTRSSEAEARHQGANPISDIWSLQALRMVSQFLVRAAEDSIGR
jgi:hydroxyacid-oxoacid transhydrogenase